MSVFIDYWLKFHLNLFTVVKIKFIMKVCIIGDGLVSLTLAKALVNKDICVDVFYNQIHKN